MKSFFASLKLPAAVIGAGGFLIGLLCVVEATRLAYDGQEGRALDAWNQGLTLLCVGTGASALAAHGHACEEDA